MIQRWPSSTLQLIWLSSNFSPRAMLTFDSSRADAMRPPPGGFHRRHKPIATLATADDSLNLDDDARADHPLHRPDRARHARGAGPERCHDPAVRVAGWL